MAGAAGAGGDGGRFAPLPASVDLPAIEHEVLRRWQDAKVFARSLEQTAGGRRWICYEGPPTANGMPGVHHIEARVLKDAFPRFRTMQGYHVPRRAGWDCHGLPVEVAVEKELGLTSKKDIEAYGIAEFNARCRESVVRHVGAFTEMTERMGYWVDFGAAYWTMDAAYIESVWWSLKQVFDQGLLVRDHRISPYCPRCGTPLSDHEMGQPDVYRTVTDPSVTVRFPVLDLPDGASRELRGADLLVWTTTPWTLPANTAVAVHPDEIYAIGRRSGHGERVVVADALFARVLGEGWHVTARVRGADLAGATYRPPYGVVEVPGGHRVITAPFVTVTEGTGLVHLAPAFGADDLAAAREHGLPVVNPVRPDGRFGAGVPLVGGLFFRAANQRLIGDLADRGLLFSAHPHEHSYPHCWRCGTALLYYAVPSWFIQTTAVKAQLLAVNEQTNWQPPAIKHGRYGEWLRSNVDWAVSRTRYWGTPLPVWECQDGHVTCVGSLAELSALAGRDLTGLDPHRPYVDDVALNCPDCGAAARRVPEVIDVWYDSGSMPFAQFGAPHRGQDEFSASFPAQFICEAIDQTRGWFYSLMAISTLVFGRGAYENVVCLGLLADDRGRKMSKHLGNVLEPMALMDAHGADAVRWFFAASGSPWATRKIGQAVLEEIVRKVLLTYWNTASFLVLYADGWTPADLAGAPGPAERPLLDRWVLSELSELVQGATAALEALDPARYGRLVAGFIDALSNWYVRRSRRRFWAGPAAGGAGVPGGAAAAFATLYTCLETLTRLMAPVTPFITDYLWGVLRPAEGPDSVHLAAWPVADPALIDPALAAQMALARRLVDLGRSARASAQVRVRQPLARALAGAPGFGDLPAELRALVADELNVHALEPLAGSLVSYTVKPSFRELGRRFGAATQAVAAAISSAPAEALAVALGTAGSATVLVDGAGVSVGPSEVIVTEVPRSGWAVASSGGETVALEVTMTPELRREGYAREMVRLVQEARKRDGLEVRDRISLRFATTDAEVGVALAEYAGFISGEVLAVEYGEGAGVAGMDGATGATGVAGVAGVEHGDPELGLTFWIRRS
jgi:isoleucyl-tRNA synthetase